MDFGSIENGKKEREFFSRISAANGWIVFEKLDQNTLLTLRAFALHPVTVIPSEYEIARYSLISHEYYWQRYLQTENKLEAISTFIAFYSEIRKVTIASIPLSNLGE